MAQDKLRVGIIGCGNISGAYLNGCPFFDILEVAAVADLDADRARSKAAEFGVAKVYDVGGILADPDIDIIVNLTIPKAHGEIAVAALAAGKHVYNEKPLALTRAEGRAMLDAAAARDLRIGCAPDTFMGGGLQTARKLIDDGWIGEPIGATAFMTCRGHESWHPDPDFFYQPGGGPMFDMGPYYLTALISLVGPVRRVTGSARITFPERTISSEPKRGEKITVNVPTHVTGILDFHNGAVGTMITSFDVWRAELPRIEIYGSEGSLQVPDPNGLGGIVKVFRPGMDDWAPIPLVHNFTQPSRGIGVADMAHAIRTGRAHRANGEMAFHALDIMHAFNDASATGHHIILESTCARPAPLALGPVQLALAA